MLLSFHSPKYNLFPKIFHKSKNSFGEPASRQARRHLADSYRYLDFDLDFLFNLEYPDPIMANVDPDIIFKALRLVPEFDGNVNVLTRFIKICDQLVGQYVTSGPGSELSNLCLINGILNKITGTAASIINSSGIPDSWLGIRTALINIFSDQRDETALYNDLSVATQGNRTPQEFYDQCQTLFSTIMTYVNLHESLCSTIEAKRTLYKKLTMQSFVRGLNEPLGSRIRCMRPESIEKALEFVQEELNVMYLQQRSDIPKPYNSQRFTSSIPVGFTTPRGQGVAAPLWSPQAPPHAMHMQPPTQQPFKFYTPQNQPRGPTRTQQMLGAAPPNYNPRSNMFRLPPRYGSPQMLASQPMSGVQHFTPKMLPHAPMAGHDWRRSGNPPPNNYFKTREMNVNECAGYDDSYSYMTPDYYYEPDYTYSVDNNNYDYNTYPAVEYDTNVTYHNSTDNQVTDEGIPQLQPQPSTSANYAEQDFRQGSTEKKLK